MHGVPEGMENRRLVAGLGLCWMGMLAAVGCGGAATPTRPGTTGVLRSGSQILPDVRVTLYDSDGDRSRIVGFGVSDFEGKFALYQDKAAGPLWLEPGRYAITLEPNGAEPFYWPPEFADPKNTAVIHTWVGGESLELDVPEPKHGSPPSNQRH